MNPVYFDLTIFNKKELIRMLEIANQNNWTIPHLFEEILKGHVKYTNTNNKDYDDE